MLDRLPPELKTEILSRVPVESLLRFRCVSKSWCARIDDPKFMKTHLQKSTATLNLFIVGSYPNRLYKLNVDAPNAIVELDNPLINAIDNVPVNCPTATTQHIRMVGSCNGLVCFGDPVGRIVVMNPSTRKHQVLPFLLLDAKIKDKKMWSAWSFGFGYDPITDDHKVVRLGQYLHLCEGELETETLICSLKDNAWREIQGMSFMLGVDQKMGVLACGSLHWLASQKMMLRNPNQIVGFDIKVEKFREVPVSKVLLDQIACASFEAFTLGVVGEWLAIHTICKINMRFAVWVMKEYGVKESWTKLFSVSRNELSSLKSLGTLAFSNNGKEILLGLWYGNLVWYNLKEKRAKWVKIHSYLTPLTAEVFQGSLIPVGVNKETDVEKAEKEKKNRKNRDEFLSKGFKLVL